MLTKLTVWLRSFVASVSNAWSWSSLKLALLTRKIYLRESVVRYREEVIRYRHFALTFYDEIIEPRQQRKDYLEAARVSKRRMISAQKKLAAVQVFTPFERLIVLSTIATFAAVLITYIALLKA